MPISGGAAIAPQDVWDILAASQTGAGSLGKLLLDNVDLKLSDYMLATGIITASDVVQAANDAEKAVSSEAYSLTKEVKVYLAGTVRTSYRNKAYGESGEYVFSKIYINDAPEGAENTHQQGSWQQQPDENFPVAAGDLVQVYSKVTTAAKPGAVDQFKVQFDITPVIVVNTVT